MAKFICNGKMKQEERIYINVNYIVEVRGLTGEEAIEITMIDGRTHRLPAHMIDCVFGHNTIRQIIPVRNVKAHFCQDGRNYELPAHALAVTENGAVRAIDLSGDFPDFMDEYQGYRGFTVDGDGMGEIPEGGGSDGE